MKIIDNRDENNIYKLKIGDVVVSEYDNYYMVIEDTHHYYENEVFFEHLLVNLKYGNIKTADFDFLKDCKIVVAELHIK